MGDKDVDAGGGQLVQLLRALLDRAEDDEAVVDETLEGERREALMEAEQAGRLGATVGGGPTEDLCELGNPLLDGLPGVALRLRPCLADSYLD